MWGCKYCTRIRCSNLTLGQYMASYATNQRKLLHKCPLLTAHRFELAPLIILVWKVSLSRAEIYRLAGNVRGRVMSLRRSVEQMRAGREAFMRETPSTCNETRGEEYGGE